MNRRRFSLSLAGLAVVPGLPLRAQDAWPARPLRVIVSFATGSGNDLMARILAPKLAEVLGQSVTVENRTGAGGMIGTDAVAKAAPDGYTLGLGTSSQLVMNPALFRSMPFDIDRDLVTIGLISSTPLVLVARKGGPADLGALIAAAKANPGKLTYGSGGNGSISHIVGESFKKEAGVDLLHVPYKGLAPAMVDLLAGRVDLTFDSTILQHLKSGKLKALATTGLERSPLLPDVPTLDESGLKGYDIVGWAGLAVPAKTAPDVVARLNIAAVKGLAQPAVQSRLREMGLPPVSSTPERMARLIDESIARYRKIARDNNLKFE